VDVALLGLGIGFFDDGLVLEELEGLLSPAYAPQAQGGLFPGVHAKGKIGFQHHGGKNPKTGELSAASSLIQFRNVSIKEL